MCVVVWCGVCDVYVVWMFGVGEIYVHMCSVYNMVTCVVCVHTYVRTYIRTYVSMVCVCILKVHTYVS